MYNKIKNFISIIFLQFIKLYSQIKMEGMISGVIAGSITDFIVHPLRLIETMRQTNQGRHLSTYQIILKIQQNYGWIGFYKGFRFSFLRGILQYGIFFFVYEKLKIIFPAKIIKSTLFDSAIANILQIFRWRPIVVILAIIFLPRHPIIQYLFYQFLKIKTPQDKKLLNLWIFFSAALSEAIALIATRDINSKFVLGLTREGMFMLMYEKIMKIVVQQFKKRATKNI